MFFDQVLPSILGGAIWILSAVGVVLLAWRATSNWFASHNPETVSKGPPASGRTPWLCASIGLALAASTLIVTLTANRMAEHWFVGVIVLNQVFFLGWLTLDGSVRRTHLR